MSRKDKVKEIFANKGIYLSDDELENVGEAIQETIEMLADEIEDREPYATVTISRYRDVAGDIPNMIAEIE